MKDTRLRLLAFPFGDYEGVRAYLDHLAREGWELTGRAGLLFGHFRPTQRTELFYDVVPADPRRSDESLIAQVRRREETGWEPVETIWGMDIYKSLPCQSPTLSRSAQDYLHWRGIFQSWLIWSLAFFLVTLLSLFSLVHFSGLSPEALLQHWYLSDRQTVLVLLLPLLAVLAVLWVLWLIFCTLCRVRPHKAASRGSLYLKAGLQLLALAAVLLLPVSLWLSQIPRLWLRLTGLALFLLLPLFCRFLAKGDRSRYVASLGAGVMALFALTMVLGWVVEPVVYSSYELGSRWREEADGLSIVTVEELQAADPLHLEPDEGTVTAFYQQNEALLTISEHYSEHWDNGLSLELTTYHPLLSPVGDLLWKELLPQGAEDKGDYATLSSGGWHQIWYRSNDAIYHLAGTVDWEAEALWPRAIAIAYANGQSA